MDSRGHVYTSKAFDEDQTVDVTRRFFFMQDVEKYKCSIFDRMNMT